MYSTSFVLLDTNSCKISLNIEQTKCQNLEHILNMLFMPKEDKP
jgi:hypothetical protein